MRSKIGLRPHLVNRGDGPLIALRESCSLPSHAIAKRPGRACPAWLFAPEEKEVHDTHSLDDRWRCRVDGICRGRRRAVPDRVFASASPPATARRPPSPRAREPRSRSAWPTTAWRCWSCRTKACPVAELVDASDSKSGLSTLRRLARWSEKTFDFRGLSGYGKAHRGGDNRARCKMGAEREGTRGGDRRAWRNW